MRLVGRFTLPFVLALCAPALLFAQNDATTAATSTETISTPTSATTTEATSTPITPPIATNDGLEAKVRTYFADVPVMAEIARCESRFRQFDNAGNPLNGGAGNMIGVFQIYATVHANFAKSLGMDIYTIDGNLAYAKHLYQKEGTTPWLSSFSCWNTAAPSGSENPAGTLSLGAVSSEVLELQKTLNRIGFVVAMEGAGSSGQETTKFGSLTRLAVRKFQCAKLNICSGDEYTTGYGLVGAKTRAALAEAAGASGTMVYDHSVSDSAAEIARLQALIVQLTAQLQALIQQRSGN